MDEEKRIALLKLGYFPVTDDFWAGAGMPKFMGDGWSWAMRTPYFSQPFMPYRENTLAKMDIEIATQHAHRNLTMK